MCRPISIPVGELSIQTNKKCLLDVRKKVTDKRLCCDCRLSPADQNAHSSDQLEQLASIKTHMCLPIATGPSANPKGCRRCNFDGSGNSYLQLRCRQRSRSRKTKLYHTSSNWRPVAQEAPNFIKPEISRGRPVIRSRVKSFLTVVIILVALLVRVTESCSSKSTPRPRPSSPTNRPNVTFQTFTCPPTYAAWYCLNGAKCFFVKVQDAILYNCECAEGYMGPRCEFKDLDGSYMPARERVILETASIAGGACIAIILTFLALAAFYVYTERHRYKIKYIQSIGQEITCIESNIRPQYVFTTSNHSSALLNIENEIETSSGVSNCSVAVVKPNETKGGLCICSLPTISGAVDQQQNCPHVQ